MAVISGCVLMEEVEEWNEKMNMTGKQLFDKYGYKKGDICDIAVGFHVPISGGVRLVAQGENEYPQVEYFLQKNGTHEDLAVQKIITTDYFFFENCSVYYNGEEYLIKFYKED